MLDPTIPEILALLPWTPQAVKVVKREWDETAVVALRVWPNPRWAVYVPGRRRWQAGAVGAAGAVLSDPREEHTSRELRDWDTDLRTLLAQVPPEVRDAIACQPRVFAWRLLQMLDAVPEAIDLARDLPVLAGLLAWPSREGAADPFGEVRVLLGKPRRRLLALVGLPDEQWIIRVMQKMPAGVLRDPGDDRVIEMLRSTDREVERRLQHLPSLPVDVVETIVDARLRRMSSFGLLSDPDPRHQGDLAEKLTRLDRAGRTRRFCSRAEVEAAHAALPADVQRLEREQWNPARYAGEFIVPTGQVVLPGRPILTLVPVRTSEEMRAHGLQMESCIPADDRYGRRAARGVGAMYAVAWGRKGGRATLWIRHEDGGGWAIAELAGPENGRVPPGITSRLEAWVASLV